MPMKMQVGEEVSSKMESREKAEGLKTGCHCHPPRLHPRCKADQGQFAGERERRQRLINGVVEHVLRQLDAESVKA